MTHLTTQESKITDKCSGSLISGNYLCIITLTMTIGYDNSWNTRGEKFIDCADHPLNSSDVPQPINLIHYLQLKFKKIILGCF